MGELGGSSKSGFLKAPKFEISVRILCVMSSISQWRRPCHSKGKNQNKTSTLEATHVGPFTPHFSFPKYPSPSPPPEHSLLFVYFFPSILLFLRALRLIDSTTKCLWQMTRSSKGAGRRWSWAFKRSDRATPPLLPVSLRLLRLLEARPNLSRYLTYVLFSHGNRSTHN